MNPKPCELGCGAALSSYTLNSLKKQSEPLLQKMSEPTPQNAQKLRFQGLGPVNPDPASLQSPSHLLFACPCHSLPKPKTLNPQDTDPLSAVPYTLPSEPPKRPYKDYHASLGEGKPQILYISKYSYMACMNPHKNCSRIPYFLIGPPTSLCTTCRSP